jgi:hypothetical protein
VQIPDKVKTKRLGRVGMCSGGMEYSSIPAISTPSTGYRLLDAHLYWQIARTSAAAQLSGDGQPRSVAKLHRIGSREGAEDVVFLIS